MTVPWILHRMFVARYMICRELSRFASTDIPGRITRCSVGPEDEFPVCLRERRPAIRAPGPVDTGWMVCGDEAGGSEFHSGDDCLAKHHVCRKVIGNLCGANCFRRLLRYDYGFRLCQFENRPESECSDCGDCGYDAGQHLGVPIDAIIDEFLDCEYRFSVRVWHCHVPEVVSIGRTVGASISRGVHRDEFANRRADASNVLPPG